MAVRGAFAAAALAASVAVVGFGPGPAAADEIAVDLELVLAVDVSGSVDAEEARLQREGYLAALVSPRIIGAIQAGRHGRIAVAYLEWAGDSYQTVVVDWTAIDGAESARAVADAIASRMLMRERYTSISRAIDVAVPMFDRNGFDGTRRVIDISGDGPNNAGRLVTAARDDAVAKGITINGIPIVNDKPDPFGWPQLPNLDLYFEDCVIGGPRAFMVVARGFEDFAAAIRRKLVLEIADRLPPPKAALRGAPGASPSDWRTAALGGLANGAAALPALPRPWQLAQGAPRLGTVERSVPTCDAGEQWMRQRLRGLRDLDR